MALSSNLGHSATSDRIVARSHTSAELFFAASALKIYRSGVDTRVAPPISSPARIHRTTIFFPLGDNVKYRAPPSSIMYIRSAGSPSLVITHLAPNRFRPATATIDFTSSALNPSRNLGFRSLRIVAISPPPPALTIAP